MKTFEAYVASLPKAEQERIRRAETEYLEARRDRLSQEQRLLDEQMAGEQRVGRVRH